MEFDRIRQLFKPLFSLESSKAVARLLYAILTSTIIVDLLVIVLRLWGGVIWNDTTLQVLVALLLMQFGLVFALRRGYVRQTAVILAVFSWVVVTYQAWNAHGIHDAVIFAYVLIILMAALVANWRVSLALTVLSVLSIWVFAIFEVRNVRPARFGSPITVARDLTVMFFVLILLVYLVVNILRKALEKMQDEIAERIRTELALRREEEKFRKIFHATPIAVVTATLKEGRLLDANNAYWKLTGLGPETSIGRTTMELMLWDSITRRNEFVARLQEQKSLFNPNYEFVNKNGEKRSTIAFDELIDMGDEPTVLTMLYDVTEQRDAEEALRRSDERFRRVFQKSPVSIVITSLDEGRIIDANAAFWKLSGHDPKTSIGRSTLELRPNLKPEQREQFVRELLEKKSVQNLSYDFVNNRGEFIKTLAFYELIELEGKTAILSMFYDMTEQDRARDALRHSETRLRAMLEAVPDMVLEIKRDGTIAQFIPAANAELNFLSQEMVGKSIARVLPSIAEQTAFAMERALDSGQLHAFEFDVPMRGEQKKFEARVSPVATDLVLVMVRDISLNKWWEAEREKLISELEQKNAELERFTYTVSHDLKSPIITIRGFLGFVREDAKEGNMARLDKDIQRINDATEKMQRLLADLLELSRVGRVNQKLGLISTNELVAEVVELLHGRLSAGKVNVSVAENLPSIYGDRPRIFEVFQNLIDNAAKFMGNQTAPHIEIGAKGEQDGKAVFYVRDNGVGILSQYQNRIFGLFDKLDPESDGTGIGLALVKRIVEFHHGKIWVESEAGDGATFFFTLPQSKSG